MGDLFDPVDIGVIQRLFYWVARRDAPLDPGVVRGGQPVIKQGRDNMRTMRCSKSGLPFYKILEKRAPVTRNENKHWVGLRGPGGPNKRRFYAILWLINKSRSAVSVCPNNLITARQPRELDPSHGSQILLLLVFTEDPMSGFCCHKPFTLDPALLYIQHK